jgi:murein DD-endopeptidase MepM/ murein hydrolase activator NlpD
MLVFLVALPAVAPPPAAGANLTSTIAAARKNQILYESAMRFQDGRLKDLSRRQRGARQRLAVMTARYARVATQRAALRGRIESANRSLHRILARNDQALHLDLELAEGRAASDHSSDDVTLLEQTLMANPFVERPDEAVRGSDADREASKARRISRSQLALDALRMRVRTIGRHSTSLGRGTRTSGAQGVGLAARVERLELGLKRRQAQAKRILAKRRTAMKRVVAVEREISSAKGSRDAAEALLAGEIRAMVTLAKRRAAKKTGVRPGRDGRFVWPTRGRLTQRFHAGHDGLDIAAARGTPIRAAAVGVVAYVGWNPWDQGRRAFVVMIGHPGGLETVYGHLLPKRRVTVGQLVKRGALIALMGNTGHSTGVHLHIEVIRGDRRIDPLAFLPR